MSYQLLKTQGYQKCVPALIVAGFLSFTLPAWFLYMKALPGRWDILRSIMFELVAIAGTAALTLVAVADLHSESVQPFYLGLPSR